MFTQVLIFVSFGMITNISCAIGYNEFLYKYEELDFQILEERNKRSALFSFNSNSSNKKTDLEIQFKSYGKNFHLLLSEDESFQEVPVEFENSDTFVQKVRPPTKFYEGNLLDDSNASIICFLSNGSLTGKISDSNYTYFIEPADLFFNKLQPTSNKIIVYRDVDIRRRSIFPHYPKNFPEWKDLYRYPNVSLNITVENSGLDIFNQTEDLFCEIEIVADHTLYNFYQNNSDKLKAVMYYHAKFTDYVFRRADFNMDGLPDGIRIFVGKVSIYKSAESENYPMVQASTISDYLSLFTTRKQSNRHCLSIAMFYRLFAGNAIGEAFKPEFRDNKAIGGICDKPLPSYTGLGGLSFNTGVINMKFQNDKPIPLGITMLAFTHEVGHAFGSAHDPLNHPLCSPGNLKNFLMYPLASYRSINSMKFSKCSREDIKKTLLLKGSCLQNLTSTCGNGIREGDEECDCGEAKYCSLVDPCCTPSDAKPPEKPCAIRSEKGFECSPKESECCDKNCSVAGSKHMLCNSEAENCLYSFCDGKSPKCPTLRVVPEFCSSKLTCNSTSCSNSSVCEPLGLKDCLCTDLTIQCFQCCFINRCVPASELGIVDSNGKPFILQPGTSCSDGPYECDGSGNCISSNLRSETTKGLYIALVILPIFGIVLLSFALCVSCRKNSENHTLLDDNI